MSAFRPTSLSLPDAHKTLLFDLVILNIHKDVWGLNDEQEIHMQVLRRQLPEELDLDGIRQNECDLDQQLVIVENYVRNACDLPYAGDMGAGTCRFMEVRYNNQQRFTPVADLCAQEGVIMCVKLWRIVLGDLLPECDEEHPLSPSSTPQGTTTETAGLYAEERTHFLRSKYHHFYELINDPKASATVIQGLKEIAGITQIPGELDPTMSMEQPFGIDSLDECELMSWYEEAFKIDLETVVYPENNTLGEWARTLMTHRTV
jgi:hypothetical protein